MEHNEGRSHDTEKKVASDMQQEEQKGKLSKKGSAPVKARRRRRKEGPRGPGTNSEQPRVNRARKDNAGNG